MFAVLTCVGFASCGDDDNKDEPTPEEVDKTEKSLEGTWSSPFTDKGKTRTIEITFKGNGIGFMVDDGDYTPFNYTYSAPRLIVRWDEEKTDTYTLKWVNNNTITATDEYGDKSTWTRKK